MFSIVIQSWQQSRLRSGRVLITFLKFSLIFNENIPLMPSLNGVYISLEIKQLFETEIRCHLDANHSEFPTLFKGSGFIHFQGLP